MFLEGTGWTLPCSHVDVDDDTHLIVNRVLGEVLKTGVTTLRCLHRTKDRERNLREFFNEIEVHDAAWCPPESSRWIGRGELADLTLAHPEHLPIIEGYLSELESGHIPPLRPPWARRGWFESASSWIQEQIHHLGYKLTGKIEQLRTWSISCVLRAETNAGVLYFKQAAAIPLFGDEPAVTAGLSKFYPNHVPTVLATDNERGWLLLKDFGGAIGWDAPLETREAMYRTFAQIQLDAVNHVDELLGMGCLDRRLERLPTHLDGLLRDWETSPSRSDVTEAQRLRAIAPRLKAMCHELAGYNVPQTLVHGDLHFGNVAFQGDRFIFFDWTDSCVTHPFLDAINIFGEEDAAKREQLRDAYLAAWTSYEPMERLMEMWKLAEPLSALHQVISYQGIVNGVEPGSRWELAGGVSHFARQLLKSVSRQNSDAC